MAQTKGEKPYPRTARVNQILREVISEAVVRIGDFDDRVGMLTVTEVEVTEDLRQAIVFMDSLSEEASAALEEHRAQIQGIVNAKTRLKRTPKLTFRIDPSVRTGEAVEDIIRRLRDDRA
ncbi:MAG: 30S ribosome-binding factor RbfA [Actinomycetota bacterium]|jgi:ribosome-binding factor A